MFTMLKRYVENIHKLGYVEDIQEVVDGRPKCHFKDILYVDKK